MNKLTFKADGTNVKVKLDGKFVGVVKEVVGGYAYYPNGSKTPGDTFGSLKYCLKSLA